MSVNSAEAPLTALFVGGVFSGTDRTLSFKYVIATDTYSQFRLIRHGVGGYEFNISSDRNARLWYSSGLAPAPYEIYYYDCDTETETAETFPGDSEMDVSVQNISRGFYGTSYVIAHHKTSEPKNRSYLGIVAPSVTTDPASSVEATTAMLKGTLEDDGGEACDVRFRFGETSDYGIDTGWQSSKESVVAFEQAITGLDLHKTYHFRAQARNSAGTVNGADRTFTTLVAIPTVTTDEATGLAAVSATLNGTLADN
ncbi:unnamed protein product, partial [marine sediment metagenome]